MSRLPTDDAALDIAFLLGREPHTIIYLGAHQGNTVGQYAIRFPEAKVFAFEPEPENRRKLHQNLAHLGDRIEIIGSAVSHYTGQALFHINSHDATHSLLPIGEQRYWASFAEERLTRPVPVTALDDFVANRHIGGIDLLQMDIQGAELLALRGAERLLAETRIGIIFCEVEFFELYKGQPLFWDIGTFLRARGYHLYSLYNRYYHDNNPRVLSWADALFVNEPMLHLPEHTPWRAPSVLTSRPT